MNDETIAALERLRSLVVGCEMQAGSSALLVVQCADLRAVLDLIERERAGGELAQIVSWLRKEAIMSTDSVRRRMNKALDQIEAGAHVGGEQ